jgi:NAD-dependent dihydropyrimidine dehydrogenase PreA subunit
MYEVNTTQCTGCGACMEICSFDAIFMVDNKAQIDETKCRECRQCLDVCPNGAIVVSYESVPKSVPIYAKKSKTELIPAKTNGQVTQKIGVLSHVMDFFNRIIIPHNLWSHQNTPYENQSHYVHQKKNNSIIGSRGIYRQRGGRGLGRRQRARGRRW